MIQKYKIRPQNDIIIGRDYIRNLGLKLDYSSEVPTISFEDHVVQMKERGYWTRKKVQELFLQSTIAQAEDEFDKKLRAAAYEKIDINSCIPAHLSAFQRNKLHALLLKYIDLFQGKLGAMPGNPVRLKLKPNAKPFHARPFPVSRNCLRYRK